MRGANVTTVRVQRKRGYLKRRLAWNRGLSMTICVCQKILTDRYDYLCGLPLVQAKRCLKSRRFLCTVNKSGRAYQIAIEDRISIDRSGFSRDSTFGFTAFAYTQVNIPSSIQTVTVFFIPQPQSLSGQLGSAQIVRTRTIMYSRIIQEMFFVKSLHSVVTQSKCCWYKNSKIHCFHCRCILWTGFVSCELWPRSTNCFQPGTSRTSCIRFALKYWCKCRKRIGKSPSSSSICGRSASVWLRCLVWLKAAWSGCKATGNWFLFSNGIWRRKERSVFRSLKSGLGIKATPGNYVVGCFDQSIDWLDINCRGWRSVSVVLYQVGTEITLRVSGAWLNEKRKGKPRSMRLNLQPPSNWKAFRTHRQPSICKQFVKASAKPTLPLPLRVHLLYLSRSVQQNSMRNDRRVRQQTVEELPEEGGFFCCTHSISKISTYLLYSAVLNYTINLMKISGACNGNGLVLLYFFFLFLIGSLARKELIVMWRRGFFSRLFFLL